MKNLLRKVDEKEICTLINTEFEIRSEEHYNTLNEDYEHIAVFMRYVNVDWTCQNYYCKRM